MLVYLVTLLSLFCLNKGSNVKVTWPDYTGPALDSYSGFITVDPAHGRALHYILIKAETNPNTAPLVVWFQGGPGCSGLLGMFIENGPFDAAYNAQGVVQLTYSDITWTKFANVVWLEQPAFVGFSYSNTSSDVNTGDVQAAADNYKFIQGFIAEWPEYAGRDLWFTGESYGGVYVPTLTQQVLSNPGPIFNQFKGFAIGNPVFSCQDGFIGQGSPYDIETFHLLYWHGLVSYTNYANWTANLCNDIKHTELPPCQYILNLAVNQIGVIYQQKRDVSQSTNWPSLDPDDIFQNFCTGNGSLQFTNYPEPGKGECHGALDTAGDYLNRPDVQKALNVPATKWTPCNSNLNYDIVGNSMVPLYEFFFKAKPGVKILVYSGDLDILTVPFAFTQPCIAQMSGKIVSAWRPWFVNGATAGYVEVYDKYTYATVKGAGHEAPEYQPLSSYAMVQRYITTGSLNDPEYNARVAPPKRYLKQGDILRRYGLSPYLKK